MKSLKTTDTKALFNKALNTANHYAGKATRVATGGGGLVDVSLKRAHERLSVLQHTYSDLVSHLRHQVERAKKTGKTLRETGNPMLGLVEVLRPSARREVQTSMAVETALARAWDEYASNMESALLAPAKAELMALFAEGESLYSSYLALVNELATKQQKERLLHGASSKPTDFNSERQRAIYSLTERKATEETTKLPRLHSIADSVEAALAYLVVQHRHMHAAFYRATHAAAAAAGGSSAEDEVDMSSLLVTTAAGWASLKAASGSNAAHAIGKVSARNVAELAPPPPPLNQSFGVSLDALSLRSDAVGGVPLVPHLLMARLHGGTGAGGTPLLDVCVMRHLHVFVLLHLLHL